MARRRSARSAGQEAATGDNESEETIQHTSGGGGRGRGMDRNMIGLLIGCVGAAMTLLAYEQTMVSSTQCMGGGLVVLVCALCIKEGFFSF